ncbi:receptor protein-tyrosine kinase [Mycolicibacterium iranicum]|uniref:Receptor protein-tyrosine kinase n=1 Tax=Mycolicibacterium iranicum TaxID=912594 RepID=A0A839QC25_MYCIR|nr:polysaccharide biosynthesis tyrosine autokinase [Mycolicibacterium iranicum]MBB2992025.1 receptor protein-tyrosine kinase [Mycolicibacterium iranicum]
MTVQDFVQVLRDRWKIICATTVLVAIAALAYSLTIAPSYQASTRLFVSTTSEGNNTQVNDGGLFAQGRVLSYVKLLTGDVVAQRTVDRLGLDMSASDLTGKIEATAPTDTVLIDVTVTDTSATRARDIANTLSDEFVVMAAALETPALGVPPNARVVVQQRAEVPGLSAAPTARNAALGAVLGAILGCVIALLRGRADSSIRSPGTLEKLTGVGLLAEIPAETRFEKNPRISFPEDRSAAADAFRDLRVNIKFLEVTDGPRILVVASPLPDEGRTAVALNLALALAESGNTVALVDADMRRPSVGRYLDLPDEAGLSTALAGAASLQEVLRETPVPGLTVLTSGPVPHGPAELLESPAARQILDELGTRFDYVVVDSPSLLKPDAAIIAASCQGAIMVVRHGRTTSDRLTAAVRSVTRGGTPVLGTVLMMAPAKKPSKEDAYYASVQGEAKDSDARSRHGSHRN